MRRLVTALALVILPFVLSLAPTAQAAINFVADLGANEVDGGAGVSLSITTTAAAPVGASIIILSSGKGDVTPSATTCTDSAGNTYTTDVTQANSFLSAICATHRIATALPSGSILTVTWTAPGFPLAGRARAFAVTGLASAPLDRTMAAAGISTSPSSGATAVTTQAEELLVGLINDLSHNVAGAGFSAGTNGTVNNCATSGSPTYSARPGVGAAAPSLFSMYCIVAATSAYQAQATTNSTWQALLATYKALLAPPTISKAFGASTIIVNASTTLTFTLSNPNPVTPLTGVGFTDILPAGLSVATPNGLTGSCGGGTITATAGTNSITLAGATLAGGASCNFAVNVIATTAGTKNNSTTPVTSVEAGPGNVATASIDVVALVPPTIAKAFGAASINTNASTTLTFTLSNPNAGFPLTGVGFIDTLPAGLVVSTPNGLTGSCGGGTITATAGSNAISLVGATLAAGASCTFAVNVTATTAGTKNNSTTPVASIEAGAGNSATASINVVAVVPPTISKAFGAATLNINSTTTLTFTLANPNAGSSLTGVGFTDTLPTGLVIATPNGLTGSCGGGTITATAGTSTISLTGATLAAGASCTFAVNVNALTITTGTRNNTTTPVTSVEGGPGNAATASINIVALAPPTIAKTFGAATINANATTTLTFTLSNPNASSLTGVAFSDTLPAGLVVATPNGLTGSCGGGLITAPAGGNTIGLSLATLAGGASCTFVVNVTATTTGTKNNTTGPVSAAESGPGGTASASIAVGAAAVPALSTFGQALVVLIVVLSGLMFLRRRLAPGR
ncbi:MAG TPA: hypothetical protein VK548_25800 [Candidatus Acidoferrum sp.]|nr:hypothetical protein [Candidatus Acidoferrum sp.]